MKFKLLSIFAICYLLLAIVFTYPLISHLSDSLPGTGNDGFLNIWNVDTFWHEIKQLHNPFQTSRVLYPLGTSLVFHGLAPFISLFTVMGQNNLVINFNLLIILSFVTASLAAASLAYHLTHNRFASFIGGLFYGFSPIMFSYLESQHYYYLFTATFYPLLLLSFFRYSETKKLKYLFFIGLTILFCLLTEYYSTVLLGITLVIAVFITRSKFKYFSLFLIILLSGYLLINLVFQNYKKNLSPQAIDYASFCHTNIAGFIIPNTNNIFLKNISQNLHKNLSVERTLDTPSYFLGWITLILALLSAIKFRKNPAIQISALMFITFFSLSLGTKIEFGSRLLLSGNQTPFYWFSKLPFLYLIDCPLRFPIALQLPIALFLAFGLRQAKIIFSVIILAVFLVEYNYYYPYLIKLEVPAAYYKLTEEKDNRTLLELPSGLTESKKVYGYDFYIDGLNSKQMYWQTIHKKTKVGVYAPRITPDKYDYFSHEPIISELFRLIDPSTQTPNNQYNSSEVASFIKKFNLGYIILSPNPRQEILEDTVDSWFQNVIKSKTDYDGFILYVLL